MHIINHSDLHVSSYWYKRFKRVYGILNLCLKSAYWAPNCNPILFITKAVLNNVKLTDILVDLKIMGRSPDLFINVKIGQGQLIIETLFVLPYMGAVALLAK